MLRPLASSPTPLRFLFVSFIPDSRSSGMGKWTHRIAEQLRSSGHSVELWFQDRFARLSRLGRFGSLLFPGVLGVEAVRARQRFDVAVVHEPSGAAYGILRALAPDLPPLIAMCHNVESNVARTMRKAARGGWTEVRWRNLVSQELLRRPFSDGAVRLADHVVCLSSTDQRYLTQRLRVSADRVSVMVNGVGPEYLDVPLGIERARKVLFVGGWIDIKGRRVLPPLWEQVAIKHLDVGLTVVGTGTSESTVLADFPPAVRSRVTVIPKVSTDAEMAALYRTHSVFLMPSLSEGSPLSVLEAMASGLPVVSASVGGVPDILTDQVTGMMFPPGDYVAGAAALSNVLSDPTVAARVRGAARAHVETLSWRSAAAVLETAATALTSRGIR